MEDNNLIKSRIKALIEQSLRVTFPALEAEVLIEYPNDEANGDYACNIAMRLTKQVGRNPREIAREIIDDLPENDLIKQVEIAGPGFINIFLSEQVLGKEIKTILSEGNDYGRMEIGRGKTIVLDYSSPNIAKPLGVHHLLSTIIGQSIRNIYAKLGYKCVSINHVGDWGTQFGKLIYAYKNWGDKGVIEKDPINELLKLYVKFHDEVEKDPEIEEKARYEFRIFEEGDKENRALWEWFVEESMKKIEETYEKLGGINFTYVQGESFYEDKLDGMLQEGKEQGVFVEGEDGSYIVEFDDENMPPFVVQKKDGATLYSTRDFATLKYRIEEWSPEKIIYVVDIAQTLHFKQLFEGAKRFAWYNDQGVHAWFGRMHMKDGKMSTRKGNVVLLDDVLDEAVLRAGKIIEEKNPNLSDKENVARVSGIGSVKYNILSQNRTTDITFDWDRMLSLEGNSAPYMQYTYARAKSILRKAKEEIVNEMSMDDPEDIDKKTHALLVLFPRFKEQIILAAEEYKPNIVSNYLYELAQRFNSFYNAVPVLRAKNDNSRKVRLEIVETASQILKNGLEILGVEVVEEM
jgi:arginyl-tRNA synthetase